LRLGRPRVLRWWPAGDPAGRCRGWRPRRTAGRLANL